jgi:hypothetical protein
MFPDNLPATKAARHLRSLVPAATALLICGCASNAYLASGIDSADFLARRISQSDGPVRVTVAVPDAAETQALTGLPLYDQGLQPVWVEVSNDDAQNVRLSLASIDSEYYSPFEVAWMNRGGYSSEAEQQMQRWFQENSMQRRIPAAATRSGLVFTHLNPGTKAFNVDVISPELDSYSFTFAVPMPGFTADYMEVDFASLYRPEEIQDIDEEDLRQRVAQDRCCSTDETGTQQGDPFNVVLVATPLALRRALLRAQWQETAASDPGTAVARQHRFRGRRPDGTFVKSRPDGSERKEFRLWLAPFRYEGVPIWVGQVVYDFAGSARRSDTDSTNSDVDEARNFLIQDLWYSQSVSRAAYTKAFEAIPAARPVPTFTGSSYFTNGYRAVVWLSEDPVALDEIVTLNWAQSAGIASDWSQAARDEPAPNDRVFEQSFDGGRVLTAVPSAAESREIFGVNLYRSRIQPVWVSVENTSNVDMMFSPVGLDPAYFTPLETASRNFSWDRIINGSAAEDFRERNIEIIVGPGETRSGYVFSRVDEGTKSFNVDVFPAARPPFRMSFFVPVPGLRVDHYSVDFANLYPESEIRHVDLDGLVAALEAMPCCVRDKKDRNDGDPLNIAFVGNAEDLYYSLLRGGWDETETIYGAALLKTGLSALFGREYRYSPVSALYVDGRPQDAAFQRARSSINERNHLRIWLTPLRFEGLPVWIGQISRDIGVRFTTKTITTHKIDPDVDETREFLLENLAYAQGLAGIGYVRGVGAVTFDNPRGNLTGDPWFSDGLRAVMWVSGEPVSISEIELRDLGARP